MEAARIPQQLLGELFVQKGLITPEELAEALEEQKTSDKRIGQILVQMGFVSRPDLATVLAEQLGVELAKQEGFGAGLWSEIKRRHPRGKPGTEVAEPLEPAYLPDEPEPRLSAIDEPDVGADVEADELDSLRQQVSFASTRLDEERTAHDGTRRLLAESRSELEALAREFDDWRERTVSAEDSQEKNDMAAADLAKLESTVADLRVELEARERELAGLNESEALVRSLSEQVEALRVKSDEACGLLEDARAEALSLDGTVTALRAELEAREGELAAGAEAQSRLAAEAGRLEDELRTLRDQYRGSNDAIAALTAQVDELRAGSEEAQRSVDAVTNLEGQLAEERISRQELERQLQEARAEAAAFEATTGELREELASRGDTAVLEEQLTAVREESARLEQISAKRKARVEELAQELRNAQGSAAELGQRVREHEQALARESESRAAIEAEAVQLRLELANAGELGEELAAAREEVARLVRVSDQRTAKVKELQALVEEERARSAAATADLEQELRSSQEERSRLEQQVAEGERVLVREVESRAALEAEAVELRREVPKTSELEQELSAIREEIARKEQLAEQRTAKVKELQALLEGERTRSAAALADLEQGLRTSRDETSRLEQLMAQREQALARETESHAALEAEAAELRRMAAKTAELEQELSAVREELARQEHEVAQRERVLAGEAEARAAAEAQLASLGGSIEALDQRLQEESAAHVTTRRELGRMEAELASLQPLTDKLAATESELAACAKLLEEVSAGLDSAKERAERDYDSDRYVVLMPLGGVYALAERSGPTPDVGTYEDVDGARFLVARIGRSPLPADNRRCAFLEVA